MIKIIKVTGNSLSPFFLSNDYVIIRKNKHQLPKLKAGDTVVVEHPSLGLIIKQVKDNNVSQEYLRLEGIHPHSTSSEIIGKIPYRGVRGKVLIHVKSPR